MDREQVLSFLKRMKPGLEKDYPLTKLGVFGSFAKNTEHAASDIDLLLMGDINEDSLIREINNAEKMLKREINYTIYTADEFKKKKKAKDSFILDLLENPKIFLMGDKDDL